MTGVRRVLFRSNIRFYFRQNLNHINASDKVIVLATSDKINGKMPHKVCGLDKIDAIVTELSPSSPRIKNFADAGARLF